MPTRAPATLPQDINVVNPSDCTTVMPCLTMKVGSQATKPYTEMFTAMAVSAAAIVRPTMPRWNSLERGAAMTGRWRTTAGGGSVRPAPTSFSNACKVASASSVRPTASSQRGDSGIFLRMIQMTSAPAPAMANM
jgi:hypothetical protein